MALSNNYRKLFVDSRWRSSGDHNDFVIELPNDVDTTRTSSVYLASCSFANTFETVLPGINDTLYALVEDARDRVPVPTANNRYLYVLYKEERYLRPLTEDNKKLYLFMQLDPGVVAPTYTLYQLTLPVNLVTVEQLASVLQNTLRTIVTNATVAWQEATKTYAVTYSTSGLAARWWIPTLWT
jgi:hypothetical protein